MHRIDRLVGIILLLQSRRIVRAEDMASHFGVSIRTIYRDLRSLETAGLPLGAEAGVGYSLLEGYHLPPIAFTEEEAGALVVAGAFIAELDEAISRGMQSALLKIRNVLPVERRDYVERLADSTAIRMRGSPVDADPVIMSAVQNGLARRRLLHLHYRSHYNNGSSVRSVEPLGLVHYAEAWHLIAWCRLRSDIRDFRIDRIAQIDLLDEEFSPHHDFSITRYVEHLRDGETVHEVRVDFIHRVLPYTGQKHYYGLVAETPTSTGATMTFVVANLHWFASWILSFGPDARVISPRELVELVHDRAMATARQYC